MITALVPAGSGCPVFDEKGLLAHGQQARPVGPGAVVSSAATAMPSHGRRMEGGG
jgi:hypothetical protein